MDKTYEPIAATTLGSAQSSVTFSSISGSYTDLVVVTNGSSSTGATLVCRFNGDTGTNYSFTGMNGNGSAASSFRVSNNTSVGLGEIYNYNCTYLFQIQNYSNTTTYKTSLCRANSASDYVQVNVGVWRSTAAITSLQLFVTSGNFNSGSTFTLYGIKAA